MKCSRTVRVLAAGVAGVALVAGSGLAAQAATKDWRVVRSVPKIKSDDVLASVSASGWHNIWAVGQGDQSGNGPGWGLALRWAGKSWKRVTAPSGTLEFWDVSANSSTNTWFTGRGAHNVYRWNAGHWSAYEFANEVPQAIVGTGGTQAWLASSTTTESSRTHLRHYTGGHWHTVTSPEFSYISAFANGGPTDIWAVGSRPSGDTTEPFAMHWNGKSWRSTPVPAYSIYGNPAALNSIVVLGKNDIWAGGGVAMEPGATPRRILVHWDGTKWSKAYVPRLTARYPIRGMVKDNKGGLYLLRGPNTVQHRTAAGKFTKQTVPTPRTGEHANLAGIAHVPGTTHTLIAGGMYPAPSDSLIYIDR